jgi:hypothetical protein
MIRQDLEATLDCQNGRVYIIPMELMNKLMKAGNDEDMAVLTAVLDGGGDMVHLNASEGSASVSIYRKHMVSQDGTNIPIVELRSGKGDRFLMEGELTREEYLKKRLKELGISGVEIIGRLQELSDEYQRLMES